MEEAINSTSITTETGGVTTVRRDHSALLRQATQHGLPSSAFGDGGAEGAVEIHLNLMAVTKARPDAPDTERRDWNHPLFLNATR